MKRKPTIDPVTRAVAFQLWSQQGVDAQLHAILGSDPQKMCNLAGRMFFTVLGAAIADQTDPEDPDIRIVRGAVNAVYDQVDAAQVDEHLRAAITSGLQAAQRLATRLERKSIVAAHFDLKAKLAAGDVHYSDFLTLIESPREPRIPPAGLTSRQQGPYA